MLRKLQSYLYVGKDIYTNYTKKIDLASKNKINHKKLAEELEDMCKKKGGVLTYAEYLTIDQFGQNGYYAKSKQHGQTDVDKRWGVALANYCLTQKKQTLLEFGCATGNLSIATIKAYKQQTKQQLNWIGIEKDKKIHKEIYKNFQSQKLNDAIQNVAESIEEIGTIDNALIVFPYSLDNIPPHIFLNTTKENTYPNALLGVIVKNGILHECIMTPEMMSKKNIKLKNGLFTEENQTYNISTWKLRKGQRAYLSTNSFLTLYQYASKIGKNNNIIIIDEFKDDPWFFNMTNYGTPRSLYEQNLVCYDRKRYYREAGEHNLYYPLYFHTMLDCLHKIGFQSITSHIEQEKAAKLQGKHWVPIKEKYNTYCFIATEKKEKKVNTLAINMSVRKILA